MLSRYKYPLAANVLRNTVSRALGLVRPPRASGNVLMLHTGRSGSTVLGNMLDQHPDIFWDGEVVEKLFHRIARRRGTGVDTQFGAKNLEDAIAHIRNRQRRLSAGRIYGLELQQYQLEMIGAGLSETLDLLVPLGFDRFVVLTRRNHLRKIVSHMVATQYQRHHTTGRKAGTVPSIRLDPKRCYVDHRHRTLIERIESYEAFFAAARNWVEGYRVLNLDYGADISGGPGKAYAKTCDFLKLPALPVEVGLKKTADFPLTQLIANYHDVAEALARTEHAWMAPLDATLLS